MRLHGLNMKEESSKQCSSDQETTTLTCPYCDYREVVHAKPSPSDHSMCAFCSMEHHAP
jgi:hypothetical protein